VEGNLSIIIVSYNCSEVIKELLESLKRFAAPYEVVVVDNASTDGTIKILKEFESSFLVHLNEVNKGFTYAINQGIRLSTKDFILLLNPDIVLVDNSIDKLLKRFQQEENLGGIAPNLYYPNGAIQNYIRRFPSIRAIATEHFLPAKYWNRVPAYRKYTYQEIDLSKDQWVEQPAGAALLFRKGIELDESYFIYGSDLDLCKRLWVERGPILLLADTKFIHHQSKGGTNVGFSTASDMLKLDALQGYGLYFSKFKPRIYAISYRILMVALLFFTALLSIVKGGAVFKSKWKRLVWFVQGKSFKNYVHNI